MATTDGSMFTVRASGPRGFSSTVRTTVALGQNWYAANAPTTTMIASRPINSIDDAPRRRRGRELAVAASAEPAATGKEAPPGEPPLRGPPPRIERDPATAGGTVAPSSPSTSEP